MNKIYIEFGLNTIRNNLMILSGSVQKDFLNFVNIFLIFLKKKSFRR